MLPLRHFEGFESHSRIAAREAVLAVGLRPEMMEYFAATGGPSLADCLDAVSLCDLVVVIAAERYGWVPLDQPTDEAKSITFVGARTRRRPGL